MDSTRITYIEEANELLANLEGSLLALEASNNDKESIELIFRIMHTLKGNSSMFGLLNVAEFVHDLETIYDKIRNNEMQMTKHLINCSFLCLDHLKNIVIDSDLTEESNKINHKKLLETISGLIGNESSTPKNQEKTKEEIKQKSLYHIYFEPKENIFENGTNPLFLLAELSDLGNCKTIPHFKKVDSLATFAPTSCITFWDIFLETEKSVNDIKDVFVFVEDNSIIEVKALNINTDINNVNFVNFISNTSFTSSRVDLDLIYSKFPEVIIDPSIEETIAATNIKKPETKEKAVSSIRVSSDKLDELMNLVSELVTTQAALMLYTKSSKDSELETISENIEKLSRRLRDISFGMTLIPINNLFGRFQRMVRDVAAQLGKEIEFITEGGETELDKTIIETLTDPLMHILRNSLDHGIELPEDRLNKGKAKIGKLTLRAFYSGVFVYIQIIDDGKGIDIEAVREKAISKGLIKENEILTDGQLFEFIFHPGFSTAKKITDVSGRGVGMDVVKRNITDIKGTIAVDSTVNEGTTLTIKLPLTLSIIDGLLVMIDKVNYVIPLSVITKCYEVNTSEMINNFNHVLVLDGEQVPFINTRDEFGSLTTNGSKSQIIVVNNGERKVGVSVDQIIGEYQAVVKSLGKFYKNQDFISGASILGDGTIALVLDTNKIIELHINKLQKK
jgi:two-component system chemotaxis sensor kinase CheA